MAALSAKTPDTRLLLSLFKIKSFLVQKSLSLNICICLCVSVFLYLPKAKGGRSWQAFTKCRISKYTFGSFAGRICDCLHFGSKKGLLLKKKKADFYLKQNEKKLS